MADDNVNIGFNAETGAMLRAFQEVTANFGRMGDALDRIGRKTQEASDRSEGMFAAMTKNIGQAAAGMIGLGSAAAAAMSAVSLLKNEYQDILRRREEAAKFHAGAAPGRQQLALLGVSDAEVSGLVGDFGEGRGVAAAVAARRGGESLSNAQAIAAARAALAGTPVGDVSGFAGGIADLMEIGGTAPQQAGMIRAFARASSMTEDQAGKVVAPFLANAGMFGMTNQREAMALYAGLGQATESPEIAGTVVPRLGKVLGEMFPGMTLPEAIAHVQGNAAAQQSVLGAFAESEGMGLEEAMGKSRLSIRGNGFAAAMQLLQGGDNATMQAIARARGIIPELGAAGASYAASAEALARNPTLALQQRQAEQAAAAEGITRGNVDLADLANQRAATDAALQAAGFGSTYRNLAALNPTTSWADEARMAASGLRQGAWNHFGGAPSKADLDNAAILEQLAERMEAAVSAPRKIVIEVGSQQLRAEEHPVQGYGRQ